LIWEDIEYQVKAGFVRMIATSNLFGENQPPTSKSHRLQWSPKTTVAPSSSIFPQR
jgi:hypothetical protein